MLPSPSRWCLLFLMAGCADPSEAPGADSGIGDGGLGDTADTAEDEVDPGFQPLVFTLTETWAAWDGEQLGPWSTGAEDAAQPPLVHVDLLGSDWFAHGDEQDRCRWTGELVPGDPADRGVEGLYLGQEHTLQTLESDCSGWATEAWPEGTPEDQLDGAGTWVGLSELRADMEGLLPQALEAQGLDWVSLEPHVLSAGFEFADPDTNEARVSWSNWAVVYEADESGALVLSEGRPQMLEVGEELPPGVVRSFALQSYSVETLTP